MLKVMDSKNQIEGFVESGQNVVVVEDLISTGKSSLNAVKALKEANHKRKRHGCNFYLWF